MDTQVSIWKVIKTDYWAFYFFMLLLVFIGTLGYIFITEGFAFPNLSGPITFSLIFFFLFIGLILRARKIQSIFEYGKRNTAIINDIHFYRLRGKVTYIFEYQNQRYIAKNFVVRNKMARELFPGQHVVIFHDPENPKSAVIDSFFHQE